MKTTVYITTRFADADDAVMCVKDLVKGTNLEVKAEKVDNDGVPAMYVNVYGDKVAMDGFVSAYKDSFANIEDNCDVDPMGWIDPVDLKYYTKGESKQDKKNDDLRDRSISSGTHDSDTLIDRFMNVLRVYARDKYDAYVKENPEVSDYKELDDETKGYIVDELFDLLNEIAPEGTYFGAIEGDGADFGFWTVEESCKNESKWYVEYKTIGGDRGKEYFDSEDDAKSYYSDLVDRFHEPDGEGDIEWVEEPVEESCKQNESTYKQGVDSFLAYAPEGGWSDYWAMQQDWEAFKDGLCRDGKITQKQADSWGNPCTPETFDRWQKRNGLTKRGGWDESKQGKNELYYHNHLEEDVLEALEQHLDKDKFTVEYIADEEDSDNDEIVVTSLSNPKVTTTIYKDSPAGRPFGVGVVYNSGKSNGSKEYWELQSVDLDESVEEMFNYMEELANEGANESKQSEADYTRASKPVADAYKVLDNYYLDNGKLSDFLTEQVLMTYKNDGAMYNRSKSKAVKSHSLAWESLLATINALLEWDDETEHATKLTSEQVKNWFKANGMDYKEALKPLVDAIENQRKEWFGESKQEEGVVIPKVSSDAIHSKSVQTGYYTDNSGLCHIYVDGVEKDVMDFDKAVDAGYNLQESKKSEKLTQKDLKQMATSGAAIDITNVSDEEAKEIRSRKLDTVAISRGTYGMNGALLKDKEGKTYVITARNSNLFYFV